MECINRYTILVWKPNRKRPLGIPKCGFEDNVQVELKGTGCEVVDSFNWRKIGWYSGGLLLAQ
jgi:hypothetical protein